VDKIMTAGRSGEAMLLVQSKPQEFQDVVTHVSLSWCPPCLPGLDPQSDEEHPHTLGVRKRPVVG
jgi:hypothetical protein